MAEIFGSVGIILPGLIDVFTMLTPILAICFAIVMVRAPNIYYKKNLMKKRLIA